MPSEHLCVCKYANIYMSNYIDSFNLLLKIVCKILDMLS